MPIVTQTTGSITSVEMEFTRDQIIAALAAYDGVVLPDEEESQDSKTLNRVVFNEDGTRSFVDHVEGAEGMVLKLDDYEETPAS